MKRAGKRSRTDSEFPADGPISEDEMRSKMKDFSSFIGRVSSDMHELGSQVKLANELQCKQAKTLAEVEGKLAEKTDEHDKMGVLLIASNKKVVEKNGVIARLEQDLLRERAECQRHKQAMQSKAEETEACRRELEDEREEVRRLNLDAVDLEDRLTNTTEQLKIAEDSEHAVKRILVEAREHFTDCITLEQRANSILLTSGQLLDLEGLVSIWLNNVQFNGDVWFPFKCPITAKTTAPVRELGGCAFRFFF
jgi:chromosome segregation ATPase